MIEHEPNKKCQCFSFTS